MIAYVPGCRGGIASVTTTYGMAGFGVRIPAEARSFLLSQNVQTLPGANTASCSKGYSGSFSGVNSPGSEI